MTRPLNLFNVLLFSLVMVPFASADPPQIQEEPAIGGPANVVNEAVASQTPGLTWHDDYGRAYAQAKEERRMLLINFADGGGAQQQLEQAIARNPSWQEKLHQVVLVRLPQNAQIVSSGNTVRLLSHPAFTEMHGRPGIAVLDLAHPNTEFFGRVVSAFPFMSGKYYRWRAEYLPTILDLPPGTITQRTMVWAVRVHPERPASTHGALDGRLAQAATRQSRLQARMGVQGHHRWEGRFHRLRSLLGGGTPVEVVAESWPNQNMIDSCIDCVASWRHSSGHWDAVRRNHAMYAYDIHRGNNGIWYGTGIFASF